MSIRVEDLTGVSVVTENGVKYKLTKQAGCGAQGVVYEESSGKYMIKLYYPSGSAVIDEDILDRVRFIKDIRLPKNFVSVVDVIVRPYVGYVMERVIDHKPLNTYLIRGQKMLFPEWYNQGRGLYERIFIGYIIAKAFGELEKNNLSYCDISGNNILIKITPKGASVRMIDIDNIYIAGKGQSLIMGTPRYIAPEVIKKERTPDVLSDNYSLAVILFELLRSGHPYISDEILDGTPEDEETALAGGAEYVVEKNSTNMLPESVVFTDKLKNLFKRCFVDGKKNRLYRPSAIEFEYALLDASNKLIKCPTCGAWHYPKKIGKTYEACPWCDSASRPTAMLNFYDILFEGPDYKAASNANEKATEKLVNSYILKKKHKNLIKSFYILRYDDLNKQKLSEDNYLTIASDEKGYHVYNEFSRPGIILKRYKTKKFVRVDGGKAYLLNSGDEIYFEVADPSISINCGADDYSFIRMARFVEAKG